MLLTCPTCRSGLEVPDGTEALVRCPACKTVFAPADSAPPEAEEAEEEVEEEEAKPRKKAGTKERTAAANRDFDPTTEEDDKKRKRKKRRPEDDTLTPEERVARRAAFDRAAWGCRLIYISFGLFILSMVFVTGYFFQGAFAAPNEAIITCAGLLGVINWALAVVGVGLCLSGPRAPGHWEYGIAAAVAVVVHLLLLAVLVSQGREFGVAKLEGGTQSGVRWDLFPTRLNATMFYLTAVVYPNEQGVVPKGRMTLSMLTGVAEMVRVVLLMMFLSCLARASLDEGLAHQCTRAAGIASAGPGLLAVLLFVFFATVIETNAGLNTFTQILTATVNMGAYSIVVGVMLPAFMAAREVADACDEPFQSLIPEL